MKRSFARKLAFVLTTCFSMHFIHAQSELDDLGYPLISNIEIQGLDELPYFSNLTQDDRGVMYFGTTLGILEYDGVTWQKIKISDGDLQQVTGLASDNQGKIFYGSRGDVGFLSRNTSGAAEPHSLLEKVPVRYRKFFIAGATYLNNSVYFLTDSCLLRWNAGLDSMQAWPGSDFRGPLVVENRIFLRQQDIGLVELIDNHLELIPGSEQFGTERVNAMLPLDNGILLIGSSENRFYTYDGLQFLPFPTEIDGILKEYAMTRCTALLNGHLAVGTRGGGVFIIDRTGHLLFHVDRSAGIESDDIRGLFLDQNGALWILSVNSVSKIETTSPLTYYDDRIGIEGVVYDMSKIGNQTYVGAVASAYFFDPASKYFQPIPGLNSLIPQVQTIQNQVLIGGPPGLFKAQGNKAIPLRKSVNDDFYVQQMLPSNYDSTLLFLALSDNIVTMRVRPDGSWQLENFLLPAKKSIVCMAEEKPGIIWFSDAITGTDRLIFPDWPSVKNMQVTHYGPDKGFAEEGQIIEVNGLMYGQSQSTGFSKYHPETDRFLPDSTFGKHATYLFPGENGTVYADVKNTRGIAKWTPNGDGTYTGDTDPFGPINNAEVWNVYPDPKSKTVWICTTDGLIRYDPTIPIPEPSLFQVIIRKVALPGDSLLAFDQAPKIGYQSNQLSFEYAAPFYVRSKRTQYQTWLEGFEKEWTDWNLRTDREFTSLPPGPYTFHVRAQNIYNQVTEESTYSFTILQPWYNTWWAIALYLLAVGLCIWAFLSWRTSNLRSQREKLETTVSERTKELELRVEELDIVNQVNQALASQLDSNSLIQMVGNLLRDLFRANIVYVALLDKKSNTITFPFGYGDDFPPLQLGQGLTSRIILSGDPLLLNQNVDSNYDAFGIKKVGKIAASYLGVPIPVGKEMIGVLSVQSTLQTNRFNEADKNLLNTIAASVGVAIHNAALYDEAQQARADAERANEAKSSFLSTVSHELRTPLTSVLGFAKIVKKRLEERIFPALDHDDPKMVRVVEQVGKNMDVITSEGERLTQLINDVLDLAKIEAGKIEWHLEPCRIEAIIDRAMEATHSLVEQKKLGIKKSVESNLPIVMADHNKLIQVVINLLSNAVKFTNQGNIFLKAYQKDDHLIVSVTDTGIGIATEDQPKVFEKFKQVGDTLTDKPQGTGLGLPICKEIIEHHGGRLWLESALGKGSTFFFSMPVTEEAKSSIPPLELESLMKQLKERIDQSALKSMPNVNTVLIVDDDPSIRGLLVQELGEAGYQVREAENGKEALEKIRQQKPDLVLLDVMMPEMNGFDVAAILKNDPGTMDIPIIILSIVQDKERGMRIGVDKYLTKPFDTEKLIVEVNALLEQGHSRKKIMVVDENTTTVKTLSDVLQARGYQVVESNGSEMLEKAKSILPDVIILRSANGEQQDMVKSLRFEKGMEHVVFLVYQ
ncbi:MAG: response regulator [Saprospiraceae bacterium]|nr:response regulator [Saprospiraceae bacterium]